MPRATYGPEVKRRSLHLYAVLLDYAEDGLVADEPAVDWLRSHIQVRWKDDRHLVVRTKVRYLEALTQLTALACTGTQIKESLRRWLDHVECLEDNRPSASGSETWHFTLKLWYPRRERDRNLQRFAAIWDDKRRTGSDAVTTIPMALPRALPRALFETALQAQRYHHLTTNPLTSAQGLTFELTQVYVPLPLQEILPDGELEEAPILEFDAFFAAMSNRTAIIGEPGAGKTTLLQTIVTALQARSLPVIWISLADLAGKTIGDYLRHDWLQLATQAATVTPEQQTQLTAQFATGAVWLLLDAVDEMGLDAGVALAQIGRELRSWVGQAKVVLSCRSAVWQLNKNPLADFRVFQNLGLPPQSTHQVIRSWFRSQPELADRLLAETRQSDRQWLRRMIQNPLRLAMLCRSWSLLQGRFPETRSALYRQFVETFYRWKQEAFPTTLAQRIRLNQVLGQLAWQALQQQKYRLSQAFIAQHFPIAPLELFDLALQIGWMQPGGEPMAGEVAYGFYHGTFQEYFAAQAVEDWQPLLALQYREVFLFWLGREDVAAARKVAILRAMMQFEDGCGGFYQIRVNCLAATGLAEFAQFDGADELLDRLLHWRFASCLADRWRPYPTPIVDAAMTALIETDRKLAIAALEQFIQTSAYLHEQWNAAYSLGRSFDPDNVVAIDTLVGLITQAETNDYIKLQLCKALHGVAPQHPIAMATLHQLIQSTSSRKCQRKAAYLLGKIEPDHPLAIMTLERISQDLTDQLQQRYAIANLAQLDCHRQGTQLPIAKPAPPSSETPAPPHLDKMVASWEKGLAIANSLKARERAACKLLQHDPSHAAALKTLMELLLCFDRLEIGYSRITRVLQDNLSGRQLITLLPALRLVLPAGYDYTEQQQEVFKLLWQIALAVSIEDFRADLA
jgi:Effector-associated domain 4/NACHT domain